MNIEYVMAARARMVYGGRKSLSGSILDKPDNDFTAMTLDEAMAKKKANPTYSDLDVIELMIADRVDGGEALPVGNPEAFQAARWLANADTLAALPDPMPRAFVLYFAKAFHDAGQYPTMVAAFTEILSTRTFI
jgi:hypothetical protein